MSSPRPASQVIPLLPPTVPEADDVRPFHGEIERLGEAAWPDATGGPGAMDEPRVAPWLERGKASVDSTAYDEGFETGRAQGALEGKQSSDADWAARMEAEAQRRSQAKVGELVRVLNDLREALVVEKGYLRTRATEEGLLLAIRLVERVVGEVARASDAPTLDAVKKALGALEPTVPTEPIEVRVAGRFREAVEAALKHYSAPAGLHIVLDDSISPGGAVVVTPSAEVNAEVERRTSTLLDAVRAVFGLETKP